MTHLTEKVRRSIVDCFLFGEDDGFPDDASLIERGILDSTGVLELVAHLEENWGIRVNDDELLPENLDSVNAICAFIERKQAAAGQT